MSTATITKIKNGTILLPKQIQKSLRGENVIILSMEDGFYVKNISTPSLDQLRPKLLKFGKEISQKDLKNAISCARQKK